MDGTRFDAMAKARIAGSASRRGALRLLAGGALGLARQRLSRSGAAAQEDEAVGCLHFGRPCRRPGQCCSGVCRGKRGKETCRAHDAGTCRPNQNVCEQGNGAACNGTLRCQCLATTGGARFCALGDAGACAVCHRDRDCVAQGFGARSACVRVGGCDACAAEGGTLCAVPCSSA